ncbi:MAG TPA: hypothetical protein VK453_21960 [Micromonosporaceae bacterium]|nr:hypothetical protein [Micromonosporaceae bacterium]HZG44552.1 hypothetical protein [Longimicrobium sp.]
MGVRTMVAFAILALGAIGGWILFPRYWRGEDADTVESSLAVFALYGERFQRGVVRSLLVAQIGGTLMFLYALAQIFANRSGGRVRSFLEDASALLLAGMVPCMVAFFTLVLFNWPKMLVPPYLRGEPGIVGRGNTPAR